MLSARLTAVETGSLSKRATDASIATALAPILAPSASPDRWPTMKESAREADRRFQETERRFQEDLGQGVRGKHYQEYQKGTNLVLLSPDVAAAFPTEEDVNEALRALMRIAQRSRPAINESSDIRA